MKAVANSAAYARHMRPSGGPWVWAIQLFFVGMLVLPTSFQVQRGVLLAVLVSVAGLLAFRYWRVHREILLLAISTLVVGLFGIALGVANDAPGALRVATVYVIWPIVFLLFIGLAHSLYVMRRLQKALLMGISIATAMALVVLAAGLLGYGDVVFPLLAFQDAGFGGYEGFTEFRIYNLTTVMYGLPFVFASLLAGWQSTGRVRQLWLWVLVVLIAVVAVGSGRRMFWLLALMTPMLAFFFLQASALRLKAVPVLSRITNVGMVAVLVGLVGVFVLGVQPLALSQQFIAAFLGQEASSAIRYEQAAALWAAFGGSPWMGNGLGSSADVVRSEGMPWAYELWYLSLLMSVGLLGFTVYFVAVLWIIVRGMGLASRDREFAAVFVPVVTAMVVFLAMTSTNPYLGKFDYLWVIFLPVAIINAYLTRWPESA